MFKTNQSPQRTPNQKKAIKTRQNQRIITKKEDQTRNNKAKEHLQRIKRTTPSKKERTNTTIRTRKSSCKASCQEDKNKILIPRCV